MILRSEGKAMSSETSLSSSSRRSRVKDLVDKKVNIKKAKSEVKMLKDAFVNLNLNIVKENYFQIETENELKILRDEIMDVRPFELCKNISLEAWHSYIDNIYVEESVISLKSLEFKDEKIYCRVAYIELTRNLCTEVLS